MKKVLSILFCAAALVSAQAPKRAPGFCLADSNGQWHDLADYRGKVVIVEFMQTTCPHCADFSRVLAGLTGKYGSRLQVLSIALPNDNPQTIREFVVGHKVTWPHLFDQGQVAASYVRAPGLNFPAIYLVDQNGMIAGHWEYSVFTKGYFEADQLSREIDRLTGASTKK
ncbi:MAG: TlpA family protein disulfide reductase [Acidobacteria bacterium]|nr:TlpA family protein disulfide reductase [Acidobacteriota bacterium]